MRFQATKPKMSANSKSVSKSMDDDSIYFQPMVDYQMEEQARRREEHKWSGNVSPSSGITFHMCMTEYFAEVENFLEFKRDTLMKVNMGTELHKVLQHFVLTIPGMKAEYPDYWKNEVWKNNLCTEERADRIIAAERSKPEFYIYDPFVPISGRIDDIVDSDEYGLVVTDLKNTWKPQKFWTSAHRRKTPMEEKHRAQVCLYVHTLNEQNVFEGRKIKQARICYVNWLYEPFTKMWSYEAIIDYDDRLHKKTTHLKKALAKGRRSYLANKDAGKPKRVVECCNRLCYRGCSS